MNILFYECRLVRHFFFGRQMGGTRQKTAKKVLHCLAKAGLDRRATVPEITGRGNGFCQAERWRSGKRGAFVPMYAFADAWLTLCKTQFPKGTGFAGRITGLRAEGEGNLRNSYPVGSFPRHLRRQTADEIQIEPLPAPPICCPKRAV